MHHTGQDPTSLQRSPPGAETLPMHSLEEIQSKSRESHFSLLSDDGRELLPCRDPSSCSHVCPGHPPHRTLKYKLPPPSLTAATRAGTENVKQLLGSTNTAQNQKASLLPTIFFSKLFKCSEKTRPGPFTRWRVREGRNSVTTGLLLQGVRAKVVFQALGIHTNDWGFQPKRENRFWKVLPGSTARYL